MQATAAVVDATLFYAGVLRPVLSLGTARRLEVVHMRWLRKATGEHRSVEQGRMSDAEVRVTYAIASTWS